MTLDTILTVKRDHLDRLSLDESISFFASLLWAEARRVGIPITNLGISSRANVPDGGVDASVDAQVPGDTDLIRKGRSVFQIKTGQFKAWTSSAIHDELFGKGNLVSKDGLGDPVRVCLDAGGSYILVCTGMDFTEHQRTDTKRLLSKQFIECGYEAPNVDAISQNHLLRILQRFPSLSLALNGNGSGPFETHKSWADHAQMRMLLRPGNPQTALMGALAEELRTNNAAVHVHVRGEAGIGKTRLVLEGLRAPDLAPLVIYCDGPSKIKDDGFLLEINYNEMTINSQSF